MYKNLSEKIKSSNKAAVLFCIAAAAVYLIILRLLGAACRLIIPGIADSYWVDGFIRVILTVITVLVLVKINKTDILKKKGKGFLSGLKIAGFQLVIIFLAFMGNLTAAAGSGFLPAIAVLGFIFDSFAVGLTEEIFDRGLILNVLADRFGLKTSKGIWLTVIISGLIFGLSHITNIFSDGRTVISVLVQCLYAAGVGMYFGAVYIRCGNLRSLICIHALNDFVFEMGSGLWGIGSSADISNSSNGLGKLVYILMYILLTAFILRRKKIKPLIEQTDQD